jgi:hypothetical protein
MGTLMPPDGLEQGRRETTIEKGQGFAYACPRIKKRMTLAKSEETSMDESQGQGPAWIVFVVWLLGPLVTLFLLLTFTG